MSPQQQRQSLQTTMITLFSHRGGPNGWKVVIVLEALGLKYETKFLDFSKGEQKAPEFTKYNPNGRIPAIIDHDNGDLTLWESNSIIKYLVDTYDKDKTLFFANGTKESYFIDQWTNFQLSGQGPYFGQAGHFLRYHPVTVPTAVKRYQKEIVRVVSVLDGYLADKEYLVGDKLTIADLSFIPWDIAIDFLLKDSEFEQEIKKYENFEKWHKKLLEHPAVKKTLELRAKAQAE